MPLDLRAVARENARRNGVDERTFERQIDQESRFNPNAHNAKSGADGIAQIVVSSHPSMAGKTRDPIKSLEYAAQYDRTLLQRYRGDVRKMLAAYNWGPGRVDNWNGQRNTLPSETRGYLDAILGADWRPNTGDEPEIGTAPAPYEGGSGISFDPVGALEWLRNSTGRDSWTWGDIGWSIAFGAAGIWLLMAGTAALGRVVYSSPAVAPIASVGKSIAKAIPQTRGAGVIADQFVQPAAQTVKITTPKPVKELAKTASAELAQGASRPSGALSNAAGAIRKQATSTATDGASGALAAGVVSA